MRSAGSRTLAATVLTVLLVVTGCAVDSPTIESTQLASGDSTPAPAAPTSAPQFQPTTAPDSPTATAVPTPAPTPTTGPTPTPAPPPTPTVDPARPTPLPTSVPADEYAPSPVDAGLVTVPFRNVSFRLADPRPILQFGGHTLIYVDDARNAEVDIFTPAATRDAQLIDSYDGLISYITSDSDLAGLEELNPVTIAGFSTRVFEGTADTTLRAFITDASALDNDQLGWFPPVRMRLWTIDHPNGPLVVSAESLENPGRYSDAVRLATEILSTIDFD